MYLLTEDLLNGDKERSSVDWKDLPLFCKEGEEKDQKRRRRNERQEKEQKQLEEEEKKLPKKECSTLELSWPVY